MKRVALLKYLRKSGIEFLRHGGRHDRWRRPDTGAITSVSRRREIEARDVYSICKDLDIPPPPKVS